MAKRTFTQEETENWFAKIAKKQVAAGLLCYDSGSRKVLIVMANYKNHWSLPGGLCDQNEPPAAASIREASEEVGIEVSQDEIEFVGVERPVAAVVGHNRLYFIFAAPVSQPSQLKLQSDEIESAKWVSADELRKLSNNRGSLKIAADWIENGTMQYADFGL